MLQASKDVIEARTAVNLISIRERELQLYVRNTNLLGTVSAIMAGIAYYGLVYVKMGYFQDSGPISQFLYANGLTVSMCLGLRNLAGTTCLAVLGPGLALRGDQKGSMHVAISSMIAELETITNTQHQSIYCFLVTLIAYAWGGASPHWICSVLITALALLTIYLIGWSTNQIETIFPVRTMKLVSGFFYQEFAKNLERRRSILRHGAADTDEPPAADQPQGAVTAQPQPAPQQPSPQQPSPSSRWSARTATTRPSAASVHLVPYHSERADAWFDTAPRRKDNADRGRELM